MQAALLDGFVYKDTVKEICSFPGSVVDTDQCVIHEPVA